MDNTDFDELAGRMEAMARAIVALAHMMELETNMDGLTLSRRWRESVGPQADTALRHTAHKTLHQMADSLDAARNRHQQSVREWQSQSKLTVQPG